MSVEPNGTHAIERIKTEKPDLVVLDLMLPEKMASICRKVRPSYNGPILMLTARTDDLDQVLGLEMGQMITCLSPLDLESYSRIRALLRRIKEHAGMDTTAGILGDDEQTRLVFNDLTVDKSMREAWLNEESIDLTSAEFDLLWLLASNAGTVLSRGNF